MMLCSSASGVTEPALAPFGGTEVVEVGDRFEHHMFDALHHELGDPLTTRDREWFDGIGVDEQHLEFTPVPTVDQTGSVEAGHAMRERESATGLDESGMALGNRHGQSGGDQRSTTSGEEDDVLTSNEIEPGVAHSGVGR